MIRKAFTMKLFPDTIKEYTNRHSPIWNELLVVLKNHGVHNYSIFHDEKSNVLFAYVEIESVEKWEKIASTEICQKWWAYMTDIMETNSDLSPVSVPLNEVFHID
ncbi:MAG: L-rhamnose mutarotase [Cyclobacteriaceae bacterium]